MKLAEEPFKVVGHLTVSRLLENGVEETLFHDNNIIVSGMSVGIARMFADDGTSDLTNFQINRFQLGVSGPTTTLTTSINQLSGALTREEYGQGKSNIITGAQTIGNKKFYNKAFVEIPRTNIQKMSSCVKFTLIVDENMANNILRDKKEAYINEIGLFMQDPHNEDASVLVAYKTFTKTLKTSDFSLIFRWTISIINTECIPINWNGEWLGFHVGDLDYHLNILPNPPSFIWFQGGHGIPVEDPDIPGLDDSYGIWDSNSHWNKTLQTHNPSTGVKTYYAQAPGYGVDTSSWPQKFVPTVFANSAASAAGLVHFSRLASCPSALSGIPEFSSGVQIAGSERQIYSYIRPYNGIWSDSLKDTESKSRLALHLNLLKQPWRDTHYNFDCLIYNGEDTYHSRKNFATYTKFSVSSYSDFGEIDDSAFKNIFREADALGYQNCIIPSFGAAFLWAFPRGLSGVSDTSTTAAAKVAEAYYEQAEELIPYALSSQSAYRINGRLVVSLYHNRTQPTFGPFRNGADPQEIVDFVNNMRARANHDFYVLTHPSEFDDDFTFSDWAFGGVRDGIYNELSSTYSAFDNPNRLYEWKVNQYEDAIDAMAGYPGRVLGLLLVPRFLDSNRSDGTVLPPERYIPDSPNSITMQVSAMHYFRGQGNPLKGGALVLSWDDHTEGHAMFPRTASSDALAFSALNTWDQAWSNYKNESYNPSITCPSSTFVAYGKPRG